jgi:hypothetical protein
MTRRSPAADISRAADNLVDSIFESASEAAAAARNYLASDEGKRLRENLAKVVIVGAPLLSQLPVVRRTPVARLLRTAAVATLLVKGAEWLRDWEPPLRAVDATGD